MAESEVLDPKKKTDFLDTSRRRFQLTVEAEADNRKLALDDDKFRNLEHWDPKIKQARIDSGRPCLVIDKLSQPIRQVTNAERQARPAIQINPVSGGANRATAEIQQGLIRQIEAHSYADVAYDWAFDGAVAHGWGYFRVLTEYESDTSFDQVVKIAWIEDPYSVYHDPTARQWNRSDARWCHIIEDLTKDNYDARYGSKKGAQKAASLQAFSGLGNQAPAWFPDGGIRIAEYFYVTDEEEELIELSTGDVITAAEIKGRPLPPGVTVTNRRPVSRRVVRWCLHNALETIDEREWAGKFIPVIEVEGERLYVNGKRIKRGLIRAAQDPQRMYDYWVSAATETTALAPRAPWVMYEGQDEGYEEMWKVANQVPFSSLKVRATTKTTGNQILPLPQRTAIEPPIQAMMIGVKQAELDIHSSTAFYDASDPRRANAEQSGKAVLARQQQGQQTNQNYLDNLARSLRYLGEILLDLMPKIYDRPGRIVQILGLDDEVQSVMLGQPFQRDETGQPQPAPPPDPAAGELQAGMAEFYDLAQGQYAVTVTVGNNYTTRRQEAVSSMLQLVEAQPAIAPLIGDVLVENMDWPGAPKLAERLKKMLPPQLQEGQPGQPDAQQLQQQLAALGQQQEQMTQIIEQQADELKGHTAEIQSKERIAEADRQSKERIAAIQAQTQLVLAQQKISAEQALASMQAQLDATLTQMEAGHAQAQQERDLQSAEMQQDRDLSAADAQQMRGLDAQDRQQGQDLAFQAQQAQTAPTAPEGP